MKRGIRFMSELVRCLSVESDFPLCPQDEAQSGLCKGLEQPGLLPGLALRGDLFRRAKWVACVSLLLSGRAVPIKLLASLVAYCHRWPLARRLCFWMAFVAYEASRMNLHDGVASPESGCQAVNASPRQTGMLAWLNE